jgi:yecA family protein
MSTTDIDHDNAERLAALLNLLAAAADEDEAPLTIDTLDGYLTALVCGPVTVSPVEAMDALFGEGWAEVLDEQEQTESFMEALMTRWNEIADALDPETLANEPELMLLTPLITEFDEATKAELLAQGVLNAAQLEQLPPSGVLWVEGFMQAVEDMGEDWYCFDEDSEAGQMLDAMLMSVAAVALPPGEQREQYIAEAYEEGETVDQEVLLDDALFSVQDLRLFWLQQQAQEAANDASA